MTDAERTLYVQFTETNDWEGETWHRYIPVDGNEGAIERLRQLIDAQEVGDNEDEDGEGEGATFGIRSELLTGREVDTLVKYANDDNTSYSVAHAMLHGILNLDGSLNKKAIESLDDLYKLEIEKRLDA